MSLAIIAFIESIFALAVGAIVGALLPRIVQNGGMTDRFVPCMLSLTAISTIYFLFATAMLEGTAEMQRVGGPIAVTLLSLLLNALAIIFALVVVRIFFALANFVKSH